MGDFCVVYASTMADLCPLLPGEVGIDRRAPPAIIVELKAIRDMEGVLDSENPRSSSPGGPGGLPAPPRGAPRPPSRGPPGAPGGPRAPPPTLKIRPRDPPRLS